eukprot:39551-Amphidinium_carterae.1
MILQHPGKRLTSHSSRLKDVLPIHLLAVAAASSTCTCMSGKAPSTVLVSQVTSQPRRAGDRTDM